MDLPYSFLSDAEPSDAQLETIMREVAEDAKKKRIIADLEFRKLIQKEIKLAAKRNKSFLKKVRNEEQA